MVGPEGLAFWGRRNEPLSTVEELLEQILEKQNQMDNRLANLEESLTKIMNQCARVEILERTVEDVKRTVQHQQQRLIDLEDRARRNNVIVFGVPESENETREDIEQKVVKNIFSEKLGVMVSSVERIHRLGQKKQSRDRPVILKLYDFNEKVAIFKNCKKLKGTKISVSDDYSPETVEKRRLLWKSAQTEKGAGAKVNLVHDKLFINSIAYTWDFEQNVRVRLRNERPLASEKVD